MRNLGLGLLGTLFAACGGGELCDGADIAAELGSAANGDRVVIGACEVQGPLRVPEGVTLEGAGGSVVVAPADSAAIVLVPRDGAGAATVANLTIRGAGRIGLYASPGAAGDVRDVTVTATSGIAIAALDAGPLALTNVVVTGEVTETNALEPRWLRVAAAPTAPAACPMAPCDCEPGATREDGAVCDSTGRWATLTAVYGIFLERTAATLTDVDVEGFASFGAVFRGETVSWTRGTVSDNLGVGVRAIDAAVALTDVSVSGTLEGLRGTPAYAIAATDATAVTTTGLLLTDNERYGFVMIGGSAHHTDLVAERNDDVALWITEASGVEVTGPATRFSENAFSAVVIATSENVRMSGGTIESTRATERVIGEFGALRVGDGLHLLEGVRTATFEDVVLRNNERAGLLLDIGKGGLPTFTGIGVSGSGSSLGAIAGMDDGGGSLTPGAPAGWDTGIARDAVTAANDAAVTGTLDVLPEARPALPGNPLEAVGVVAPMF